MSAPNEQRNSVMALSVVGMAALWLCSRISFYALLFDPSFMGKDSLELLYTLFLAGSIAFLVVCAVLRARVERFFALHARLRVGLAFALCVSFLLLASTRIVPDCSMPLGIAGSMLAGVGFGALLLAWALSLAKDDLSDAVTVVALAFPLHMIVASIMSFLEGEAFVWLYCAMPFASAVSWVACFRIRAHRPDGWMGGHRRAASGSAPSRSTGGSFWRRAIVSVSLPESSSGRTIVLVSAFIYVGVALWGFLAPEDTGVVSLSQHLATFVLAGITFVFLLVGSRRTKGRNAFFKSMRTVLVLLFFAGLFFALMFDAEKTHIGTSTLMAARFCLEAFAWILLLGLAARTSLSAVSVFGLGLPALVVAPTLLGNVTIPWLVESTGLLALVGSNNTVILAATFALVVTTILLLSPDASLRAADEGSASCSDLAMKHGLTPREGDVLELLAQGNSQKRISDILHVAPTTVQTHTKAVYRKLGVHTKQELLDLVHGRSQEE